MSKLYDPKCEELARHFLPDGVSARLVEELSVEIQAVVEDWMEIEIDRMATALEPSR